MEFGNKLADFLRQGADTLINLPTEAQRFITNPQAFTELVTGKNPLPKETGFVAGASGLPPKNPAQGGVLNPASAPYQEGYEQGEPVAIASMALPAYASALRAGAPKAYNALENYMVKSGGMIPLEAYHGTPHKIEGAFDIKKMGTGEGAQAYGPGMYFAENPEVAKSYRKSQIDADALNANSGKSYNSLQDFFDDVATEKGNLYKVDIPDEYIPTMLDWDKALNKQTPQVQAILKDRFPSAFDDPRQSTGQALFKEQSKKMGLSGQQKPEQFMADYLNEYGIKGIRYLDEGSRKTGGTSNFVVFEPSKVKILEENGKPIARKELLKKQVDDLK